MKTSKGFEIIWSILRITLGFIFLWAFFDKLLGLGFATTPDKSWLHGVSPTLGFLKFGVTGTFAPIFNNIAGNALVDWLFMMGLLGIGVSFILGIFLKLAGYCGALMVLLIYLAGLPLANNPIIDEHIIYALIFLSFTMENVGHRFRLSIFDGKKNKSKSK